MTSQITFPSPYGRRTHGVYATAEEAMVHGRNLVFLLNGIPFGFHLSVFQRLGAFVLVSHPKERRP